MEKHTAESECLETAANFLFHGSTHNWAQLCVQKEKCSERLSECQDRLVSL